MPYSFVMILEIVGTVAFAASGAMTALKKEMDIFGVAVLGLLTAVGGGIIRDIILGCNPPAAFTDPIYSVIAVVTSIIIFMPSVRRFLKKRPSVYEISMLIMDSIGLGVFTVVGIQTAKTALTSAGTFLLIFVGIITGVGGGLLRDICAGNTPYIFTKHFYACASAVGSILFATLWNTAGESIAAAVGTVSVIVLRLLAARFKWSLPKSKL